MFVIRLIGVAALGLVLALSGLSGVTVAELSAQEAQAAVEQPASIRAAIEQNMGKRVKLELRPGA
jgi:hypothetical protein